MDTFSTMPGLSGFEQLRALIASGNEPSICRTLDFHLTEIGKGSAVFEATPGTAALNPIGSVHGGFAAAMLDSACGCAVHTLLSATQAYTTLELKIAYHRAMTPATGLVRASGTVLSIGRRTAFADAKLTGSDGKLYASATSTLLVMERD